MGQPVGQQLIIGGCLITDPSPSTQGILIFQAHNHRGGLNGITLETSVRGGSFWTGASFGQLKIAKLRLISCGSSALLCCTRTASLFRYVLHALLYKHRNHTNSLLPVDGASRAALRKKKLHRTAPQDGPASSPLAPQPVSVSEVLSIGTETNLPSNAILQMSKEVDHTLGPTEDNQLFVPPAFLGLFAKVSQWRQEFDSISKRKWHQMPSCAGRVGHFRPSTVNKIGEGASFNVFKRYDGGYALGRDSRLIVIKHPKIRFSNDGSPSDEEAFRALMSEINILSHRPCRVHRNIVKLLDIRWDHPLLEVEKFGPSVYLEYAEFGTLPEFCASDHPEATDDDLLNHFLLGICRGLQTLYRCGITMEMLSRATFFFFERVSGSQRKFPTSGVL